MLSSRIVYIPQPSVNVMMGGAEDFLKKDLRSP
jgi:hypothetical protein